jgi:O-antigen ligase
VAAIWLQRRAIERTTQVQQSYLRWPAPWAWRIEPKAVLLAMAVVCVMVAEGAALAHSYVWAAPLAGLVVIAVAVDLPLAPLLGITLLVRILTDASLSSALIRHTDALNLSGAIALLFVLVAIGLVIQRGDGIHQTGWAIAFLGAWTMIAVYYHGLGTETIREGVREASILALGLIAYNSRGALSMSVVVRLLQIAAVASAVLAIDQFLTHTGIAINGEIRSHGTFVHPNGAAMFFAIACTGSVWRYVDHGRKRLDALLALVFAAATVSTFSFSGLAALVAMLATFGTLRGGSLRRTLGFYLAAALLVVGFLATPLGAERLSEQASTDLGAVHSHETSTTSLGWRFYKWELLLAEWERAPVLGRGIGTTVTAVGHSENVTAGQVPHNEYLRYLVETGIVGLAIVIAVIVLLLRALARRRDGTGSSAAMLGTAVVVGCLVNGLADNTFLYTTTGYAAALVIGAALALPRRGERADPATANT